MTAAKMLPWISTLLIAIVWMGCERQSDPGGSDSATHPQESQGGSPLQPSPEALVILAKADAFDGAEDKVISKCLICSLGMDGKAGQSSTFGSYEVHLCSETCKKHFAADPEQAVLTAKLPASLE